jgi:DNA-binding beta-propeller fold protein YncE
VNRALVALALFFAGCAHQAVKPDVVWPQPPEKARIRFVRSFRHTDDLDSTGWASLRRTVFGGSNDPALGQPMGLALSEDGERLYIADFGASHVFVADLGRKTLKLFAPDEAMGKSFNVALDDQENVYASDPLGGVIHVFSKAGRPLRTLGTKLFERPTGIALDRARRLLYVSDSSHSKSASHRVRVLTLDGQWVRDLGTPQKGDEDGYWNFPTYIALDPQGNVYVADSMNFRIQVFDPTGKFLRKYGENGDGPGAFSRLKGLAFDGFGNLYAVDGGHSNVQLFNKDFQVLMFFGGYARRLEYFDIPSGIAIDPKRNRIYICNEFISRVNVYDLINTRPEDSLSSGGAVSAASGGSPMGEETQVRLMPQSGRERSLLSAHLP